MWDGVTDFTQADFHVIPLVCAIAYAILRERQDHFTSSLLHISSDFLAYAFSTSIHTLSTFLTQHHARHQLKTVPEQHTFSCSRIRQHLSTYYTNPPQAAVCASSQSTNLDHGQNLAAEQTVSSSIIRQLRRLYRSRPPERH